MHTECGNRALGDWGFVRTIYSRAWNTRQYMYTCFVRQYYYSVRLFRGTLTYVASTAPSGQAPLLRPYLRRWAALKPDAPAYTLQTFNSWCRPVAGMCCFGVVGAGVENSNRCRPPPYNVISQVNRSSPLPTDARGTHSGRVAPARPELGGKNKTAADHLSKHEVPVVFALAMGGFGKLINGRSLILGRGARNSTKFSSPCGKYRDWSNG